MWLSRAVCVGLPTSGVREAVLHVKLERDVDPICLYITTGGELLDDKILVMVTCLGCVTGRGV
jgi:hypothetical protein